MCLQFWFQIAAILSKYRMIILYSQQTEFLISSSQTMVHNSLQPHFVRFSIHYGIASVTSSLRYPQAKVDTIKVLLKRNMYMFYTHFSSARPAYGIQPWQHSTNNPLAKCLFLLEIVSPCNAHIPTQWQQIYTSATPAHLSLTPTLAQSEYSQIITHNNDTFVPPTDA